MIVKRAYHRIQTTDGQVLEGPVVVELDENGNYLSHHILQQEEPATEWVGGTFVNS